MTLVLCFSVVVSACGKTRDRNSGLRGQNSNGAETSLSNRIGEFPQITKSHGHDLQVIAVVNRKELPIPKAKTTGPVAIGTLSLDLATVQYRSEYDDKPLPKNSRSETATQTVVFAVLDPNYPDLAVLSVDRGFDLNTFRYKKPLTVNHQRLDYCAEMHVPDKGVNNKIQILSQNSGCNPTACSVKVREHWAPNKVLGEYYRWYDIAELRHLNPAIRCVRTAPFYYYQTQLMDEQEVLSLIVTLDSGARLRIRN